MTRITPRMGSNIRRKSQTAASAPSDESSALPNAIHCAVFQQVVHGSPVDHSHLNIDEDGIVRSLPTKANIGMHSEQGLRDYQEDHVNATFKRDQYSFFGVYDGHGGDKVSRFLASNFSKELARALPETDWDHPDVISQAMKTAVRETEASIPNGDAEEQGSTVNAAMVTPTKIVVGNVGDSRAVLIRGGEAIQLTRDQEVEAMRAEIEAKGGKIEGSRVPRLEGLLAMSASVGDNKLKKSMVDYPEISFIGRSSQDQMLVLASDGLWGVVTPDEVARLVSLKKSQGKPRMGNHAREVSSSLTKMALRKGGRDNVTVVAIDL